MTDEEQSPTFEAYVAARGPALLRFGYVLSGDRHLSEDLVQEGLARAHRRWAKISALDHPDAYVRRIMVNEFLSWRRRLSSRLNVVVDPQEPNCAIPTDRTTPPRMQTARRCGIS